MIDNIKNKIKINFNKSWKTYDKFCHIQNKISEKSIALLLKYHRNSNIIGDFACGTGQSTLLLVNNVVYNKCYAVDFSENLLSLAKHKVLNNNVKFILSDIDKCLFNENYFDLIFCNMGLQWSLDLMHTLSLFNFYLAKNGLLVFSIPNSNNFPELKSSYKNTMLKHKDIENILRSANFKLQEYSHLTYVKNFTTTYDAIKSIKSTGANCLINDSGDRIQKLSKSYINRLFIDPSNPSLTYKIGIYVAEQNKI